MNNRPIVTQEDRVNELFEMIKKNLHPSERCKTLYNSRSHNEAEWYERKIFYAIEDYIKHFEDFPLACSIRQNLIKLRDEAAETVIKLRDDKSLDVLTSAQAALDKFNEDQKVYKN